MANIHAFATDNTVTKNNSNAMAKQVLVFPKTVVTANLLAPEMGTFASGASVMAQDELQTSPHATLGDVLSHHTGVSSDTFGQGATRPIIRGQTAPRVKVMQQGLTVNDASQISPDHQVSVDVNNAKQIEVIKGAATLMYGGGAIGGVVNVVDSLIATKKPKKTYQGNVSALVNQASNGYASHAQLQARHHNLVATANISKVDQGNYLVPHWDSKKIDNSWQLQNNLGLGLSYVFKQGHLGFAYQKMASEYGLPGHSHNSCQPNNTNANQLDCGHHHHHHAHGEPPYVDLINEIYRFSYEQKQPHPLLEKMRVKASYTNYAHDESDEGKVATRFDNAAIASRMDAKHIPMAGAGGFFTGIFGASYNLSDFSAVGSEKFIPKTKTNTFGLYLIERYSPSVNDAFTDQLANHKLINASTQNMQQHAETQSLIANKKTHGLDSSDTPSWYIEFGVRKDYSQVRQTESDNSRFFSGTSASLEAGKTLFKDHNISARLSHSSRMPTAQALYANGAHIATNTYERGNNKLKPEKTSAIELSYKAFLDDIDIKTTLFASLSHHYIYGKTTDMSSDGVRLIDYTSAKAQAYGGEVEARYYINDIVSIGSFADLAILKVKNNGSWTHAPRVPASRIGADIQAEWSDWEASISGYHRFNQNRIANFETHTPSYNMLNAKIIYQGITNVKLFLAGTNLLNELAYNHASYLVDKTPKAGRAVNAGFTYQF